MNQIKNGKLLLVTGLSGAGKTTLVDALLPKFPNLKKIVSYTTREPRSLEKDGDSYFFVSKEEFFKLAQSGFFFEVVRYGENFYGTPKTIFFSLLKGKHLVFVVNIQGALFFKHKWPRNVFLIFISSEDSLSRIKARGGENSMEISTREKINRKDSLIWKKNYRLFSLSINNQDFPKSLGLLKAFCKKHHF